MDTAMQIVGAHASFGESRNIAAIANYLSALDPNPNPVKGTGDRPQLGREIFGHICASCHAPDGKGNATNRVPRIAGQHYPYLRRQIEQAAQLHMDLAPPEMTSALRGMGNQDKDALADYISRLNDSETSHGVRSTHTP